MNLVVNASAQETQADGQPVISAVALRVRNAHAAHNHCVELGAWTVPSQAQAMELHIPAIHGPGGSRFTLWTAGVSFQFTTLTSLRFLLWMPIPLLWPA